ncbi:MAG: Flp pilus assembly complex ATPase component TadA [Sphaerochaeta sp.]|nr:Flp pilus assembly complex ATPase component TadA [Sphaerochaeta sp.]
MAQGTALLESYLAPLEPYLKHPDIIDVCIQEEGVVRLQTIHGNPPWIVKRDKAITFRLLNHLAEQLAVSTGQKFHNVEHPRLSTSIPGYGYRVQILGSGVVGCGFAMSIRVAKARRFPLSHYFNAEDEAYVRNAIERGTLILIVGGTGSGKTTLMNSLLECFPEDHRIFTIEDAKELVPTQKNVVDILVSKNKTDVAKYSYEDAIDDALRMNPDAILLGEITVGNSEPFLNLSNTGHGTSMATLHAKIVSPDWAFRRIALNCQMSKETPANFESMYVQAKESIELVITAERKGPEFQIKLHKDL